MSDYLWDRKGEPGEDVEGLENLLGNLAYRPRPLELPELSNARPRRTTRRLFVSARFFAAVAAALILMLLAGAALPLIMRRIESPEVRSGVTTTTPRIEDGPKVDAAVAPKTNSGAVNYASEKPPRPPLASAHEFRQRPLRRRRDKDVALKRGPEQADANFTAEGRRAKDQLMLALRVAGANLGYVRRQVREIGLSNGVR